jgi:FkbM family methyltransferase
MSSPSLPYRIARRLRYEYLRRFNNPATLTTRQGIFRVPIGVDDPISKELFLFGEFELDLIVDAMDLLRKRSGRPKGTGTIIDVGANNGVISIAMLVTGQLDRAVAIEPEPANFKRLEENVRLNHLDGAVRCVNSAVSDRKSSLAFELSESNWGDHRVRMSSHAAEVTRDIFNESRRSVIDVPADTLDTVLAGLPQAFTQDVAVMWIDVQGYEGYVFAGARELLARDVPVVSEINPYFIARAGMSPDVFSSLVGEIWPCFWMKRQSHFARYPITAFRAFMDDVGFNGYHDNVIFTHS